MHHFLARVIGDKSPAVRAGTSKSGASAVIESCHDKFRVMASVSKEGFNVYTLFFTNQLNDKPLEQVFGIIRGGRFSAVQLKDETSK